MLYVRDLEIQVRYLGMKLSTCWGNYKMRRVFLPVQRVLEDLDELDMVRHECAEALGSIATPEFFPILERFVNDKHQAMSESCIVALDIFRHENSDEFQYADGIQKSQ